MTDANGKIVKDGDVIITTRGVRLDIEENGGILFFINSGNMQKRKLSELDIEFEVLEKK